MRRLAGIVEPAVPPVSLEMRSMPAPRFRSAFIPLETALVGAILTFIAVVVVVQMTDSYSDHAVERDVSNRLSLDVAAARYHRETGRWPAAELRELIDEGYLQGEIPTSPFPPYEPYRFDPKTKRVVGPTPPTQ